MEWAIQYLKGKSMRFVIMRIAWKTFIYCVWMERNNKVHNNASEIAMQVLECIKESICIRLAGLKRADNATNRQLIINFGI